MLATLIVGATRGLGASLAKQYASKASTLVYATTRAASPPAGFPDHIKWLSNVDLTSPDVGDNLAKQLQGGQPLDARDGGSNKRFEFAAPPGYPATAPNWLTQWVDDDTVVVTVNRAGNDDLLECHFSTRACTLAVRLPEHVVVPEIG